MIQNATPVLPGIPANLTTSAVLAFLTAFSVAETNKRKDLVVRFQKDHPLLDSMSVATLIDYATGTEICINSVPIPELTSTAGKKLLGDLICFYPIPSEVSFAELYKLHIILYRRCYHNGIHDHLFGRVGMNGSGNEGAKSPIFKALIRPDSPSNVEVQMVNGAEFYQGSQTLPQPTWLREAVNRLKSAALLPGAEIRELLPLLYHVLVEFAKNWVKAHQLDLFDRQNCRKIAALVPVVDGHIKNCVNFWPKHFVGFLDCQILKHAC